MNGFGWAALAVALVLVVFLFVTGRMAIRAAFDAGYRLGQTDPKIKETDEPASGERDG